ncbi:hypothetical protein SAMN04488137_1768 [Fictibacillus solisalsi]|uniref:Uncharacterized protein n=1 Tax=Fictibacillus solisalsi TaxID=459525 RepID=A0A1G9VSN3_9BACL|nr:hypothetical protein [Fictibacillus solisalsi]SDM75143.1 hypothetical protein SAMN04488137_1768 [Fictibacillus solisalsi]
MLGKKFYILFIIGIIVVSVIVPIITNELMFIGHFKVAGKSPDTWIGYLGSFWGAIIGGVISGVITLVGVMITIKASVKGINDTIEEQRRIRDEDNLREINKERLSMFYGPIDNMASTFHLEYGAHYFHDLTPQQQEEFVGLVVQNTYYADKDTYIKVIELTGSFKNRAHADLDKYYNELRTLISDEVYLLREKLQLPERKWE